MKRDTSKYPKEIREGAFLIWKELGETPLQALEYLRKQEGIETDVKMTYAGRLDPLAEGELLILVGEECKKKDEYLGLDKEYEVEILLGVQTDTGDVMGVIDTKPKFKSQELGTPKQGFGVDEVRNILSKFIGKISWPYPIFSSKTVQGKPLFVWALEGKIGEVEIPTRESEIYELELLSAPSAKLSISELRELVHTKINSIPKVPESIVDGKDTKRLGQDFRRAEVLQSWADFFDNVASKPLATEQVQVFDVIKIRCKCSSGTYMRTLAQKVGEELGVPALALSIVRTEIVI